METLAAGGTVAFPGCEAVIEVVPGPMIVTRLPETVATDGFEEVYATGKPDEADAIRLNGASVASFVVRSAQVIVFPVGGVAGEFTVTVLDNDIAGLYRSFPSWEAVIVVVPGPRKCRLPFSITAMPGGLLVKVNGNPLEAPAPIKDGGSPKVKGGGLKFRYID